MEITFADSKVPSTFEEAFETVKALVKDFQANEKSYLRAEYQEAETRKDFIDKFFIALGWDVNHDVQKNPYEQEVKVEPSIEIGGRHKRADYSFSLAPNFREIRFFAEAKKPSVVIDQDQNYFQTMRYAYTKGTPFAVLTNFIEFRVLDCRYKPKLETVNDRGIKELKFNYLELLKEDNFRSFYHLFSRTDIENGSLERFSDVCPKPRGGAVQKGLFPGGYKDIDVEFLEELDTIRVTLARAFKRTNAELSAHGLTEAVQRTIDRLVFIRFLEDKLIEEKDHVSGFGDTGAAWKDFVSTCRKLDPKYNGLIFHEHFIDGSKFRAPDAEEFSNICEDLSLKNSPYHFDAFRIDILGSIYERFLGKVIRVTNTQVKVEEKPEVIKAGGVFYTPQYVVKYIVENTVGKLIEGKNPEKISEMCFADISCGSGSFLLGVYDLLINYHTLYYNKFPKQVNKGDCEEQEGHLRLSLKKKRDILLNCIYGVDIDPQAVEVTQLSLYLKLLEDETTSSASQIRLEFKEALLPSLGENIKCGNSLIAPDYYSGQQIGFLDDEERYKVNVFDWETEFKKIMKNGGFDALVGNPPYIPIELIPEKQKEYLQERFSQIERKFDSSVIFILAGLNKLNVNGKLGFISSITWQTGENYKKLREYLFKEMGVEKIVNLPFDVFPNAYVDTGIYVLTGKPTKSYLFYGFPKKEKSPILQDLPFEEISVDLINGPEFKVVLNQNASSLFKKYSDPKFFVPLGSFTTSTQGLAGNRFKRSLVQKSDSWFPFLEKGQAYRYNFEIEETVFTDMGDKKNLVPFYEKIPKLLIRRVINRQDRLMAAFTDKKIVFKKDINPFILIDKTWDIFYLLGLLNSKFVSYLYINTSSIATKDDFRQTTLAELRRIPIRVPDEKIKNIISEAVSELISLHKGVKKAKTEHETQVISRQMESLETLIDKNVYLLYDVDLPTIEKIESGKLV